MINPVELAGFLLSLAMVYCNIKEIHWGWPLAILSSALYSAVFWENQLYGESILQLMFILMAAWGWHQWRQGEVATPSQAPTTSMPLAISWLEKPERFKVLAATLVAWPALTYFLDHFTDSDVAPWDGLVTAMSLTAQYLLGRKKMENWGVWILVNLLTVGLMVWKSLWLTAVLYGIFAILSIVGWRTWRAKQSV